MSVSLRHHRRFLLLPMFSLVLSAQAGAQCTEPALPTVPDAASATKEDMLAAYRDMRAYQQSAQSYLDCLDALKLSEPDVDVEVLLERLNAYNRTVDNMDAISRQVHRQLDSVNAR
ncbi:hypothetical protein [Litorivivens sp.]|uniref:hypothetical protein n=1 Tax=Litorivivens sp. TaxID=2020868 RepID=UPI00356B5B4E